MSYEKLFENFINVLKPQECDATGEIQTWLNGTLLRNSPGMFDVGSTKYKHWFDGLAYIQRYHFVNGKMTYSARFLETENYNDNMRAKRIVSTSFGTKSFPDPHRSIFYRMTSYFVPNDPTDNANIGFVTANDGVYALTESPLMSRIDIDTLGHLEQVDVRDYMNVSLHTYSTHFHSDKDGNMYNVGSHFGRETLYVFGVTKDPRFVKDGEDLHGMQTAELLGEITATDLWAPSYYHSFGMTEHYFILFESPLRLNMKRMLFSHLSGWCFQNCLYWDENAVMNVLLFDRKTCKAAEKRKVKSDAFFSFHHANSYESNGFLVLDYVKIANAGNLDTLLLEHMRTGEFRNNPNFRPYLHRMIIPLDVNDNSKPGDNLLASCDFAGGCEAILKEDGSIYCTDKRLCEISLEFPRYCYDFNARDYRYVYGTCLVHEPTEKYGVVKVDVKNCTYKVWDKDSELQLCAEPILVTKPGYKAEDEGVLIFPVVTVPDVDVPYVVILDAQTMDQLCRFLIPQSRIPLGFHSHFIPPMPKKPKKDSEEAE